MVAHSPKNPRKRGKSPHSHCTKNRCFFAKSKTPVPKICMSFCIFPHQQNKNKTKSFFKPYFCFDFFFFLECWHAMLFLNLFECIYLTFIRQSFSVDLLGRSVLLVNFNCPQYYLSAVLWPLFALTYISFFCFFLKSCTPNLRDRCSVFRI